MLTDAARLHRQERRFLILYSVVLLIVFSPVKALGQVAPLLFLGGLIFGAQVQPRTHLLRFTGIAITLMTTGMLYYLLMPEFSFINYGLAIVTLSSFLVFGCDFRYLATPSTLKKISKITFGVLLFEALYGIMQALVGAVRSRSFDIANGDMVRGTIEPSFMATTTGGNAIFAILLSSLFLFVLATGSPRWSFWRIAGYVTVLLAWIMASVLHTIIFLGGAVVAAVLLLQRLGPRLRRRRTPKRRNRLLGWLISGLGLGCTVVLILVLLPTNLSSAPYFARTTLTFGENVESGKALATYRTLILVPQTYPFQPLIGFGLGQYSGRAALMRTGRYLTGSAISLPPYTSQATQHYIMSIWDSPVMNVRSSSTLFPFYSWLALYGELGLLGVTLVGGSMIWVLLVLRRCRSDAFPHLHFLLTVLMLYIFLLGIQDNYWEFTQAVFPAILCWKLAYTTLRVEHRARVSQLNHPTMPHQRFHSAHRQP